MRLPFRYCIFPVSADPSFHHHNRLGVILPDVLYGAGGELGTIPKIEGLDAIFTASRSRNMSIVGILQGTSQLKERYGEETAETMFNSCHDTIAGAFGPLSQDAEFISKQLGSRTAQTGSVTTDGKTGEQSSTQQMMEVPLMAPNELREMPKGEFVLLKTFCRSTKTHMPLFTEWSITLEEKYRMPERAIREVKYMDVLELMEKLKKAKPAEKLSEGQENSGNKALWLRKPEPKSNDSV